MQDLREFLSRFHRPSERSARDSQPGLRRGFRILCLLESLFAGLVPAELDHDRPELFGASQDDVESVLGDITQRAINIPADFERWGIATRNLNGTLKSSEELLRSVADRIQHTSSRTEQFALVDELIIMSGVSFVAMLSDELGSLHP